MILMLCYVMSINTLAACYTLFNSSCPSGLTTLEKACAQLPHGLEMNIAICVCFCVHARHNVNV